MSSRRNKPEHQFSDQMLEFITELNGFALVLRRGESLHGDDTAHIIEKCIDLMIDTRTYERTQNALRARKTVQQSAPA